MRVVVAMSGGVDSSVAAALLAREGHEVIGLSMQLYDHSGSHAGGEVRFGSCCTIDDLHDARRVARQLGIPHYIVNFERQFDETVVSNFVREYASGRTPIPCVHCNGDLKFATLAARAEGLGARLVATGHYARVEAVSGQYLLKRGVDPAKDQSYFLFTLTQDQLAHALFPVGALDKPAVRALARELDLAVSDKPDSHEICFVADGDHNAFLETHGATRTPGAIRDVDGRVVGTHDSVHRFTVGQRKGLGLSAGIRLYVVNIDATEGAVTVGPREALERTALTASGVNWIAGTPPPAGARVTAQIRHRHREAAAAIEPIGDAQVTVAFDEPQYAITPGQAVVFYDGDVVLGGGWID
jgi:tRNA-specific 2-thiouridylase